MNRIRIGLLITAILGMIFASAGLFDSLLHVAIGLIVSGVAVLLYGLVDYLDARRDDELARGRAEVWARRDGSAYRSIPLSPESANFQNRREAL